MSSRWSHPQEIRIPIPYGHIAAKAWGNEGDEPVLALHGWQDNAGTFDSLIPRLSSNLYIVAVDSLGHGLSSHKPLGTFYIYMEMLLDFKRVVNYLGWDKFSFIGHSMGGTLALLYASVYPESVKSVVLLDILRPGSRDPEKVPGITHEAVESMLRMEKKLSNPAPVYTVDQARERLMRGMFSEITRESADIMMKRGCRPSKCGKGVIFTRDIRVQLTEDLQKLTHDGCKAYMSKVCANLLFIFGKSSVIKSRAPEIDAEFVSLYKEKAKSCQMVVVDGNHFVHLNDPERVAPFIDNFFTKHCNETSKM